MAAGYSVDNESKYTECPDRFSLRMNGPHLIYAGSVFTHIGDLEDTWLMELRRITRPQGRLFITVSDNHTIDILMSSPPGHWLHNSAIRQQVVQFENDHHFLESGFQMIATLWEPGNAQILHDKEYIAKHWGCYFEILAVVPEATGYQTAIILRKPTSP